MLLLWKNTKKTGMSTWKKYLKCKKLNYFATVCRSKYKINEIDDTNSNTESDHDINELYIYLVGSSVITKDNEITLDTTDNDFNITFKLDPEAQSNITHIATFNKIKNNSKLSKTKTTFKTYGEHNIDIVGKCNMILSPPKKNLTSEFFIVIIKYTMPLLGVTKTYQDLSIIIVHNKHSQQYPNKT